MPPPSSFDTVVDADTLRANLTNSTWRVIDCRHDLLQPQAGERAYASGHIAGAVFAHLDRDLSGAKSARSGRHPLPDPQQLVECFRRWGIDQQTQIVVYDAQGGQFAGRLWWLARWLGHDRVALLDGGWQAALKAGLTIETTAPSYPAGRFERASACAQAVDVDGVQRVRADPQWLILDARAPDRYAGENETIDPIGGHIPGAVNRFWQSNLDQDGRFKSPVQLRSEFATLLAGRAPSHVIAQCGSGVTACHNLLAMQRAGLLGARLYPGSWSQWITDATRPIAVGKNP
jgi:thiosulfate/3-mercaptopyruvate sulfurtransferase